VPSASRQSIDLGLSHVVIEAPEASEPRPLFVVVQYLRN
jgi:hypothetical protein